MLKANVITKLPAFTNVKWFNQADVMPRKGKMATNGLKQIQAQLLGTQGHT
jgi:hypothetical protein